MPQRFSLIIIDYLFSFLEFGSSFEEKRFALVVSDHRKEFRIFAKKNGADQETIFDASTVLLLDLKG